MLQASPLSLNVDSAKRLHEESVLRGHQGCVNRLAWNDSGSLLASGSDDTKVLIWSYPHNQVQPPLCVNTEHTGEEEMAQHSKRSRFSDTVAPKPTSSAAGNLFGVRFLPESGDRVIVTGAMDRTVQLHTIDTVGSHKRVPNRPFRHARGAGLEEAPTVEVVPSSTTVYECHRQRVKHVEVAPGDANLFFSASEDG